MPTLSIIFVNYNVKYFLSQAIHASQKACKNIDSEIFVVDNASTDGSIEMLEMDFPDIKIIQNKKNVGFSKANNQAIKLAKGKFILLLNPDTVVAEDTFEKCISFMEKMPKCGALGVRMLDGAGNFLPESKRSLPQPAVAFYKIFGLSKLFPKSKRYGRYHLTFLDEHQNHEVEILAGAFMFCRKKVLDEIGLLDETYFMYGEDIDLSYRVILGGFKNYFCAETSIIHYKGESTKKQSVNYIRIFYKAMVIFAQKYFSKSNARTFAFLINFAIFIRAGLAIFLGFFKKVFSPILDALLLFAGMFWLKEFWEKYVKYEEQIIYPDLLMQAIVPLYIFIWLGSVYFSGGYDKPFRATKMIRGLLVGTVLISAIYGFFDESYRFSRGLILAGTLLAICIILGIRLLLQFFQEGNFKLNQEEIKRILVLGNQSETNRLLSLLQQAHVPSKFLGFLSDDSKDEKEEFYLDSTDNIKNIIQLFEVNEIIFCGNNFSNKKIITWIEELKSKKIEFKILPEKSNFIIGSKSVDYPGDLYTPNFNLNINLPSSKRNKRVFDFTISFVLILLSPFLIWCYKKPFQFYKNIFAVLFNKKTLIGYVKKPKNLPKLKKGILSPLMENSKSKNIINQINLLYAKDYTTISDWKILKKYWRFLDK